MGRRVLRRVVPPSARKVVRVGRNRPAVQGSPNTTRREWSNPPSRTLWSAGNSRRITPTPHPAAHRAPPRPRRPEAWTIAKPCPGPRHPHRAGSGRPWGHAAARGCRPSSCADRGDRAASGSCGCRSRTPVDRSGRHIHPVLLPHPNQLPLQRLHQRHRQQRHAVLLPLAPTHHQLEPIQINVLDPQGQAFEHAKARPVQ